MRKISECYKREIDEDKLFNNENGEFYTHEYFVTLLYGKEELFFDRDENHIQSHEFTGQGIKRIKK